MPVATDKGNVRTEVHPDVAEERAEPAPPAASITGGQNSIPPNLPPSSPSPSPVVAIDYIAFSAVVRWRTLESYEAGNTRIDTGKAVAEKADAWCALDAAREQAYDAGEPEEVRIGDRLVIVHPRGAGGGASAYYRYRLEFEGIRMLLSERSETPRDNTRFDAAGHRSQPTYKVEIPGEPLTVMGLGESMAAVDDLIAALGGDEVDDWINRLDVAGDLPGVPMRLFDHAFDDGRFITTAKKRRAEYEGEEKTGLYFGSRNSACHVVIYNKAEKLKGDARTRPQYVEAIHRRWGGAFHEGTRVEASYKREWFKDRGIDSVADAVAAAESAYRTTIGGREDKKSFLRLADRVPDRKNNNQSKAGTDETWLQLTDAVYGDRIERVDVVPEVRPDEAARHILSYASKVAAASDWEVDDLGDVLDALRWAGIGISDDWIRERYAKHRKALGRTGNPAGSFRPEYKTRAEQAVESEKIERARRQSARWRMRRGEIEDRDEEEERHPIVERFDQIFPV